MNRALLTAVSVSLVAIATAQSQTVNYSTANFSSGSGWNSTNDPLWQGQQGWTGSGSGADSVSVVDGYSLPGGASGTLGVFLPDPPLNTTNVYLERLFTPADPLEYPTATVTFVAEWSILTFGTADSDTFRIDLRNTDSSSSVLGFTMGKNGVDPGFNYVVTANGSTNRTQFESTYGGLIRMVVDMTGTTYSGSYALLDPTTRTNIASFSLNSGTLANGATVYDIGALRLDWILASGASNPGDLGIVVNEFTVSTIPEPSTVALLAMTGLGAAFLLRRRRD
jgi:hypothetical protein